MNIPPFNVPPIFSHYLCVIVTFASAIFVFSERDRAKRNRRSRLGKRPVFRQRTSEVTNRRWV